MRRKDKEMNDERLIERVLNEAQVLRIAMCDGTEPYLVAMNFVYKDSCLYMHSAKAGRKIDILGRNDRVAFQADIGEELRFAEDGCSCSMKFYSVFGTGSVSFIDDTETKARALDDIMLKYTGRSGFSYSEAAFNKTLIIRVDIKELTGKKSGYQE